MVSALPLIQASQVGPPASIPSSQRLSKAAKTNETFDENLEPKLDKEESKVNLFPQLHPDSPAGQEDKLSLFAAFRPFYTWRLDYYTKMWDDSNATAAKITAQGTAAKIARFLDQGLDLSADHYSAEDVAALFRALAVYKALEASRNDLVGDEANRDAEAEDIDEIFPRKVLKFIF